jgi:DNA repair exonuclease SbcCD ATPase subunit
MGKLGRLVLFVGSSLAVLSAGVAFGQGDDAKLAAISGMVGELSAAKAQEGAETGQMAALNEQAAPKNKEMKVWIEQMTALKSPYAQLNAATATHNENAARQRAAVERYNANCAGKTLPRPAFERCNGEKAQLDAWKARVDASKANLDGQQRQLNQRRDNILARAKVLEGELNTIRNRYLESEKKLAQARQRIAALTARLQGMCRSMPTSTSLEEIKLKCGNVDFDGANPNLPPCDTERCREFDRLNRGR